jgi:hypothetical protein
MTAWLSSLKLSLSQWVLVSMTAVIGLLVALLKLQGTRLHKAQINALTARIDSSNLASDTKVDALQDQLEKEIWAYENAHN